jgi:stress response protein YsnF
MITREQSSTVMDHPVLDSAGQRIGSAAHVFLDDATGAPSWVGVKAGRFGGGETLVPLERAQIDHGSLALPFTKQAVKDAPHVRADSSGHISPDQEQRLHSYYAGTAGVASAGMASAGMASAGMASAGTKAAGTADAADTEAMADTDTQAAGTMGRGDERMGAEAAMAADSDRTADMGADTRSSRSEAWRSGGETDPRGTMMTRSEERMRVHNERREAGHAALHRHVVVEEVERAVPVRREHARLIREPIAEGERSAVLAQAGSELADAEYELTLWAESPVVDTEVVPVERVRLVAEDEVADETVRARLRHEEIEVEGDVAGDARG